MADDAPSQTPEELILSVDRFGLMRNYSGKCLFCVSGCGSYTSDQLRIIADEMDKRSTA